MARKVVRKAGVAAGIDSSVINLLARSAHVVLLVIGLVTTLGTLGIDVSAIVASLGLTGFAVGFALKDSISNLLSGVLILIHRPFNVGDTIKVKTFEGLVSAIDLRYTKAGAGRGENPRTQLAAVHQPDQHSVRVGERKLNDYPISPVPIAGVSPFTIRFLLKTNRQNHRRSVSRPAGQLGLCPGGFWG